MPLYDFKCTKCEHEFEDQVKLADVKDVKCPECGKKARTDMTRNNPGHYKHGSWSRWRVGHGS